MHPAYETGNAALLSFYSTNRFDFNWIAPELTPALARLPVALRRSLHFISDDACVCTTFSSIKLAAKTENHLLHVIRLTRHIDLPIVYIGGCGDGMRTMVAIVIQPVVIRCSNI